MDQLLGSIFSTGFAFAVLRVMTPLLFPALGVAVSELAGSINIALEGIMLVSAFAGSLFLALLAGLALFARRTQRVKNNIVEIHEHFNSGISDFSSQKEVEVIDDSHNCKTRR